MAEYSDILKHVDSSLATFDSAALKAQKKLMEQVMVLSKELDHDPATGAIKTTIANLQKIAKIKAAISKIVCDDQYKDAVTKLCEDFEKVYQKQASFYKHTFEAGTIGETAAKKQKLLRQLAVQNTIEGLTGSGIQAQITDKLADMLTRSVTSGARWTDMVAEMKAYLDPDGDGTGAFAKYAKTYATTAMGQFTGQNNKLMTDALDTEWYMYVGSEIDTTREFCQHLTKKRYIHVTEIPTILSGNIDGHQCAIYAKTNLPQGMIEGTTPENFQVNVGGWNCRHQLLPVAEEAVPADLRAKFEALKQEKIQKQKEEEAKKKAEEEKKQAQEEVFGLLEQFKDYPFAKYANAKKMAENGDIADLELIKSTIQSAQDQIAGFTHIPNAMELAKELDLVQLSMLNEAFEDYSGMLHNIPDPQEKIDFLQELQKEIKDGKLKPYKEAYIADEMAKATNEVIANGVKATAQDVKAYVDTHPKSKKIIDLYNEAEKNISDGDFDAANKNLAAANKQIKSNQSSSAASAKKAEKAKAEKEAAAQAAKAPEPKQFTNFMATAEEMDLFSEADLMSADAAIGAKLQAIAHMPLEVQKKKLTYEITYVEDNKKYPTWKIAQKAYTKKLAEIEHKIQIEDVAKELQSLLSYQTKSPKIKELLVKAKDLIASGDEKGAKAAIDEANAIKAKNEKQKSSRKAKAAADTTISFDEDNFTQEKKDAAKWHLDRYSAQDDFFKNAVETWKQASREEKVACVRYTEGSGYITKFLRGIDGFLEPSSSFADLALSDSNLITSYIARSKTTIDRWIKRDEKAAFSTYKFGVDVTQICDNEEKKHRIKERIDSLEKQKNMAKGEQKKAILLEISNEEKKLKSITTSPSQLVGKVGVDESFMSCGTSKDAWFSGTGGDNRFNKPRVCLNIYCPKGTMMTYADAFNYFSTGYKSSSSHPWNGSTRYSPHECEIFMQRGTKMRVTKAEYSYEKDLIYIDVDVIGQSCPPMEIDSKMYTDAITGRRQLGYFAKYSN